MKEKPVDRRVARTRALLESTFHALLQKGDYESITVEHICATSNVGRSTFYSHYRSKDDLKRQALEHLRRQLSKVQAQALGELDSNRRFFVFVAPLFDHARDHLNDYRALKHGRGREVALGYVRHLLSQLITKEVAAHMPARTQAVQRDYCVAYLVGACMALLTRWLDQGVRQPSDEIVALYLRMTKSALSACAGGNAQP